MASSSVRNRRSARTASVRATSRVRHESPLSIAAPLPPRSRRECRRRVPEEVIKEASVRANRDALTNDLVNLASRAQQYYRRKVSMGGGDGTFVGLTADDVGIAKLTSKVQDKNGTYSIIKTGDETSVKLEGLGTQKGTDGSFLKVQMTVFAESTAVTFVN